MTRVYKCIRSAHTTRHDSARLRLRPSLSCQHVTHPGPYTPSKMYRSRTPSTDAASHWCGGWGLEEELDRKDVKRSLGSLKHEHDCACARSYLSPCMAVCAQLSGSSFAAAVLPLLDAPSSAARFDHHELPREAATSWTLAISCSHCWPTRSVCRRVGRAL